MSVKITKLEIKDFQQFKNLSLDFTDPKIGEPLKKVCLIGGNGTGKSTILRAMASNFGMNIFHFNVNAPVNTNINVTLSNIEINTQQDTLSIFSPSDSETLANFSESTTLNDALTLLRHSDTKYNLSSNLVRTFWQHLTALIKLREADLLTFQKLPENRQRTIAEVDDEFLSKNPDILAELSEIWNPILEGIDLKFDYENASIPVQLTDQLNAHIKTLSQNENIPYEALSSGIKNFILRLGLIFTIVRLHNDKQGVIFIDEPENSLHPDFLLNIISYYEKVAPHCQLFFATHNPIVAAQFSPEARFILEYKHEEGVIAHKGISPEGDDPNDILTKDFSIRSLYGEKGLKSWQRFKELENIITSEQNKEKKIALLREYLEIGRSYNFPTENEISA